MQRNIHASSTCRNNSAFTLPELLVASVITAAFFSAAALVYQSITVNQRHLQSYQEVIFPTVDVLDNYFALNVDRTYVYGAPSYGRAAAGELVRERFWEDIERSSGVFCLNRTKGVNDVRPTTIDFPANIQGREIVDSAAFFDLLVATDPNASITYSVFRNVSTTPSGTMFITEPGEDDTKLRIRAIYDIDLLTPSSPAGVYASVKRFVGNALTNYYDVFYEDANPADFGPFFVAFEKASRLNLPEGTAIDKFKQAKDAPFYFIWWPDPALPLRPETPSGSFGTSDPRAAYKNMGMRSSFFFTVPVFPPLS